MNNMLAIGSPQLLILLVLYLVPLVFLIYWLIKMLKNSNENLKITREILDRLKNKT